MKSLVNLSLADWKKLSTTQQMGNIGSEVFRAIKWKTKKKEYAHMANLRALELFDLTISDPKNLTCLKEITRAREVWLDFFLGENQYNQTADQWNKYFYDFSLNSARSI